MASVSSTGHLDIVGMIGGHSFAGGDAAIRNADLVIGDQRLLAGVNTIAKASEPLDSPLDAALDRITERVQSGARVCVLASGDPGFFGIARALITRLGHQQVTVYPAPSSVAIGFGRLGISWDDAVVVSAHGRKFAPSIGQAIAAKKCAVLCGPNERPQEIGRQLLNAGCGPRRVVVCSRLGELDESVHDTDLQGLAAGEFDPLSVVVVLTEAPGHEPNGSVHALQHSWAASEDSYAHRGGMITKSEVRAVVLAKLELPDSGVLWDVGAGSGSVAIDAAHLAPRLRVIAIEQNADDAQRIRENADAHGVAIEVIEAQAPAAFSNLPPPDRVFVGGGGVSVLDAARSRLRPAGVIVATFAALSRAATGAQSLGNVVQVNVARGVPIGSDGDIRFAAENPVFVCWGHASAVPEGST